MRFLLVQITTKERERGNGEKRKRRETMRKKENQNSLKRFNEKMCENV